ncbi:hypothetical protein GCM10028807_21770 [Spirosoma daeguense]
MKRLFISLLFIALTYINTYAQTETYAEKLGFPKGRKVVIFHVDDAGMSYESNMGTINAFDKGIASSASVMMPCGWVPHFFDYLKKKPTLDVGVHLTLTSEWKNYRWHPLVGKEKAPGLYDEQGNFWPAVAQVVEHASADEIEAEIRAQLAQYRAFGLQPTHMDSHMGTLFEPKFLPRYVKVAMQEKVPILFPGGHATLITKTNRLAANMQDMIKQVGKQLWDAGLPVLDDLDGSITSQNLPAGASDEALQKFKTEKYIELLKSTQPGITYIIMHCTAPTPQFDLVSSTGQSRKGDMLGMMDPALKAYIDKEGIIITTWRELMERRKNK